METTDLAWAAGCLDCDGHIGIHRFRAQASSGEKSPHYKATMQVVGCIPEITARFQELFGGNVHRRLTPQGRPVYYWTAASANASAILKLVLPYLVGKKEQARLCIALQERKFGKRGRPGGVLTTEELLIREALYQQSLSLNVPSIRRGVTALAAPL